MHFEDFYMIKDDPGAIVFTRGFSLEDNIRWVNQLLLELIEKLIIMTISKAMIMYIGIRSKISRPTPACIYTITPHIDRYPTCI